MEINMTKRLFIFAAYDKDNIIDKTLLHYLHALSKLGDIIFTMDNDTAASEMKKLSDIPNILHTTAVRHNEYDFGSYKRGYIWARDNKILNKYDWIYLVNDSVYGPFYDLGPALTTLESRGVDLIGMCSSEIDAFPPHVQSWFVGLSKKVANADFFRNFITNVTHQNDKGLIVLKYEVRMSRLIKDHGYEMSVLFNDRDAVIYQSANPVLNAGVPFVKKATMKSIRQIEFLTPYTEETFSNEITNYATRHKILNQEVLIKYKKIYRFSFLGIPIFSIWHQESSWGSNNYKVYIFDKMPVFNIVRSK